MPVNSIASPSDGYRTIGGRRRTRRGSRAQSGALTLAVGVILAHGIAAGADEAGRAASIVFTDVTTAVGIDFVETIGDDDMTNIVESTGTGCGFLDYDNDGWLDVYLVNGCWLDGVSDPKLPATRREQLARATDRLYHNRGDGTFEDVTVRAGVAHTGYGMAVVVADYDNDGDADVFVTNHGPNFLYRNNGDGTFTDVAQAAGVDDARFSVGAAFLDYDRDGWLDLYVGNYLTYDPNNTPEYAREIVRSPLAYEGQPDRLFHANGDGTFTDVTEAAGIDARPVGRAMGVGAFDYDEDGQIDVFVANDAMENFLWRNTGKGRFENDALLAGVAFSEAGAGTASMAVEIVDYDGDGHLDALVPDMNLCCLYRNLGGGMFEDTAVRSGLGAVMNRYHSWGGVLADFDGDGLLDAYIANGDACRLTPQPNRLFRGVGSGRFEHVSGNAGSVLAVECVSRGVARGDFDNDGDIDLLVSNLNARPALLRNDTPRNKQHWLSVLLEGGSSNRDAIGAVVRVTAGGRQMVQARLSAGGYLSQHDPRLHFGLGSCDHVDQVEVRWPNGTRTVKHCEGIDTLLRIKRSEDARMSPAPPSRQAGARVADKNERQRR